MLHPGGMNLQITNATSLICLEIQRGREAKRRLASTDSGRGTQFRRGTNIARKEESHGGMRGGIRTRCLPTTLGPSLLILLTSNIPPKIDESPEGWTRPGPMRDMGPGLGPMFWLRPDP